jgi:drug/metabolite transporter (DMT)-like permease
MNSNLVNTEAMTAPLTMDAPLKAERLTARRLLKQWWIPFSASSIFVVSGHLLIKSGLSAVALSGISEPVWARIMHYLLQPQVMGGLLVYMLGSFCWMAAVAQQEISFLYPLSSVNYVLVVFSSSAFFHESLSGRRLAGVALIVLGMILMNRKVRGEQ